MQRHVSAGSFVIVGGTDYRGVVQPLFARLSPAISAWMIVTYLAAGLLVCDPQGNVSSRPVPGSVDLVGNVAGAAGVNAAAHSAHSAHSSSHGAHGSALRLARTEGAEHAHGGHGGRHLAPHSAGHRGQSEPSGHSTDSTPKAHPAAHPEQGAHAAHGSHPEGSNAASFRDLRIEGLVWAPTCLCGCSETRSTIGGNLSRLGSVVPGTFFALLPEPERRVAESPYVGRYMHRSGDLDPIPI